MLENHSLDSRVTTEHRARLAYIYVRQSSLGQVMRHRESTDMQYQLVERAIRLGWPRARIVVIDEDLGKSGTSAVDRLGFQQLIAEVGLGNVGLVLSFDASRLARNNRDWYQLLELCSVFGTLLADSERVYDPALYTDRLLLGLSGMMSEAELYHIRRRLQAGAWNKALRGELKLILPVGLLRLSSGEVVLHPDEQVRARIALVFAKFQELKTARAVMRYLRTENLLLPTRPTRGPAPHELLWQPARSSMVLAILKNPTYAGTYVYGRETKDPTRCKPGHPYSGTRRRVIDEWPIVIHNVYPAYISWETFLANQAQIDSNHSRYAADRPGTPQRGPALLQGIVRCGRCGALMRLRYAGKHGDFPVYICAAAQSECGTHCCQEVRGRALDVEVERLVLEALAPDNIALALAALETLEEEYATLKRQRELHLERMRYEAERARRQYDAVEPENRLVARTLERRWEEKLRDLEKAEQDHRIWVEQQYLPQSATDRQDILALASDLPQVWQASTTTATDRKRILRLVIKEVIVDQKRVPGQVWFQINWQTGAISQHRYTRGVSSYAEHPHRDALHRRIRELHSEHKLDDEIAATLNAEGYRATKGHLLDNNAILLLRKQLGLPAVKPNGPHPARWADGTYSVEGAAQVLGVFRGTILKWLGTGRLRGSQLRRSTPWKVHLTPEDIDELNEYIRRVRRSRKGA